MNQDHKQQRRAFLTQAGLIGLGSVALAKTATAKSTAKPTAAQTGAPHDVGYQETEHVKNYYKTLA